MSALGKFATRLLWLVPLLSVGVAQAAAVFDPEWTDPNSQAPAPIGTVGGPVASGYQLNGSQQAFIVDYSSVGWYGDLHSYNLTNTGVVSAIDNWDGGAKNQLKILSADTGDARAIVTSNGSAGNGAGIAFRWASLTTAQKTALDNASINASTSPILDYIRGNTSNEQPVGTYRSRKWVLGDIIHSTPRVWNDGTDKTVFVGANDGMLHAFDAVTGVERFAYIPSQLISKLPNLTNTVYLHKYFVDGQFAARKFGSQSILVGSLGGGGKGLYALDITAAPTSESTAAGKVLWEISSATTGYSNLGHTYGTPQLTVLPDGTNAAVVANGYNNTGNGHAVLYLINPANGTKLAEIDTGLAGAGGGPNGLSSPTLVDTDFDGKADLAYAGDIDGHLWKFDLAAKTATLLYTTSPAQAITVAPGWKLHSVAGYMVTFATGRLFTNADEADTSSFFAYGIWDRPSTYSANAAILTQTMTEQSYTGVSPSIRVRTATKLVPNWAAGAANHMGWKVQFPIAGERVIGDGGYVPDTVYLFMSVNPTINPTHFPPYENWWMQLNALTGGDNNIARFDLNGDNLFTTDDTVPVTSGGTTVATNPVARFMGGGVRSQLTEFSTTSFEIFLANYDVNGDPPTVSSTTIGVAGGHFDFDIYYGTTTSAGTQATLTITVGTGGGQTLNYPANLGVTTYNGTTVIPALTQTDLPDGTKTTINATTIKGKVTGGFTATVSGSTVTIKAPVGADYNGTTLTVNDGTSQTPLTSNPPSAPTDGTVVITDVQKNQAVSIKCGGKDTFTGFNSLNDATADPVGKSNRLNDFFTKVNANPKNGYTPTCTKTVSGGYTTGLTCSIAAPVGASACSAGFTVDANIIVSSNTGPQGGSATTTYSGWTNFKPALTVSNFAGGTDAVVAGYSCSSGCKSQKHVHEYDKVYDRTGVDVTDPSLSDFDIANAIPSKSTPFKVIVQNQYLSPAVKLYLHGGVPANQTATPYDPKVDAGYVALKNYQTVFDYRSTGAGGPLDNLDISAVPIYTRANVGTIAFNMPVDAFSIKDWWGGANGLAADPRAGLIPTQTGCVNGGAGATDGIMYEPVIPPGMGGAWTPNLTVPAYGLLGYGTVSWVNPPTGGATTQTTARGARHNGALTLQVISSTTPQDAIEPAIPGHPEYGFRVKAANYAANVLVEYTTFWHHPNGKCFGASGWVKDPPADTSTYSAPSGGNLALAAAHGDPKIGALGSGGTGVVAGTTTTTHTNPDGSITTTTVTITINSDGSATTTTTVTTNGQTTTTSGTNTNYTGGVVNSSGIIGGGVTTPADAIGRVNWRELLR